MAITVERSPSKDLREKFGLTQAEFARLLGYSVRTVAHWESGEAPGTAALRKYWELERLYQGLASIMKLPAKGLGRWLRSPNPAFDGHPPLTVIEAGHTDRLWRMIFDVGNGGPA